MNWNKCCDFPDIVKDEHEGTIVCKSCCLVLVHSTFIHPSFIKADDVSQAHEIDFQQKELLMDWIENGFFPAHVVENVLCMQAKLVKELTKTKVDKHFVSKEEILAASLFILLVKAGTPRTSEHISFISGVSDDRILRITHVCIRKGYANVDELMATMKPSVWIPVILSDFQLKYRTQNLLSKVSDDCHSQFAFSPITILLACAYCLHIRGVPISDFPMTKSSLAKKGGVSFPTLNKAVKRIQSHYDFMKYVSYYKARSAVVPRLRRGLHGHPGDE